MPVLVHDLAGIDRGDVALVCGIEPLRVDPDSILRTTRTVVEAERRLDRATRRSS